jgi:hypothetical protein
MTMKNAIVELVNDKNYHYRILDKFLETDSNGSYTSYLTICLETKLLQAINPKAITKIMFKHNNEDITDYTESIIKFGI